ncbi:MAG: aminotransferase class III-fold pyridoxal phosphate-dependent enzyme [Planctomycetaceae bacterium]|jgi:acetylornithine/succinyldiaminopimelate/putrescine aminotransferase|nr:aminotransferase class III-fold pyridoxal phosphate-dependent enzyme [Planctomycetaceae bacterium]
MTKPPPILDTCRELIDKQIPNLFRLYLNPYVAQACVCLEAILKQTWSSSYTAEERLPTYLGNAFEEVLSGACKLARYETECRGTSQRGLILDPAGRLKYFESISIGENQITLIPDIVVLSGPDVGEQVKQLADQNFGFVVILPEALPDQSVWESALANRLQIVCLDRDLWLDSDRDAKWRTGLSPDVVVFDESFVNQDVPFSAMTARSDVYGRWMQPGTSTFHSTTYQPNSISTLHLVNSLTAACPDFIAGIQSALDQARRDLAFRSDTFAALFSPSLRKAIRTLDFNQEQVIAQGHNVMIGQRCFFDGVAGVACSIRGHNPPTYVSELETGDSPKEAREYVSRKLASLSGLDHHIPGVSGGGAVETALKLGLAAQFPKKYVLAFQGGFGGKTLLALTGTANPKYKAHLGTLYEDVIYIDPFASDVCETVDKILDEYSIAIVQFELVQGVGGVVSLPDPLIAHLQNKRDEHDYLIFVDEVQTGMFRTGPFLHSADRGVAPDLVSTGKATSDMMFPFAFTLFSDRVKQKLEAQQSDLVPALDSLYDYDLGYQTVANTFHHAEANKLSERVRDAGQLFSEKLHEALDDCPAVADVRVFGLLLAIELKRTGWLRSRLQKMLFRFYFVGLLQDRELPMIMGFCQYKPYIMKFTPPLSVTDDEIEQIANTLRRVFNRPLPILIAKAVKLIVAAKLRRK